VNAGFADTDSSNISNCFWDVNTSGVSFSYGGVGKTTTEMKTKSTFTSAGWNESIWTLCDGAYPSLVWEGKSCPVASPITVSSLVVGNQKVVTLSCPTCGSNKIEYRSDNSPWISYDNNFKLESAVDKTVNIYTRVLDSSNEIIVPETANSINVPASTQTDSTFTIVNPTGSAPAGITGGGVNVGVNAHLISRSGIEGLQFVSSLNSSNLSQMMPNSCEFTLDDGMLWISGETGMVGTTPVCLTKDYNQIFSELPDGVVIYFKFVVQARAKDLSGNYSKSGKALIVIGMGTPSSIDMCGIGKPGCSI